MHELKGQLPGLGRHLKHMELAGGAKPENAALVQAGPKSAAPKGVGRNSYDVLDLLTIAAAALMWLATVYPNAWAST